MESGQLDHASEVSRAQIVLGLLEAKMAADRAAETLRGTRGIGRRYTALAPLQGARRFLRMALVMLGDGDGWRESARFSEDGAEPDVPPRLTTRQMDRLITLREDLEASGGWPRVSVDAGLLLYDVLLALGADIGTMEAVLGPAAGAIIDGTAVPCDYRVVQRAQGLDTASEPRRPEGRQGAGKGTG